MGQTKVADSKKQDLGKQKKYYAGPDGVSVAADPVVAYMKTDQLEKLLKETQKRMEKAAKELDFIEAARLRDELMELKQMVEDKKAV